MPSHVPPVPRHRDNTLGGSRSTERLRLLPIGLENVTDLWLLHQDPAIAEWYAGAWTEAEAEAKARAMADSWSQRGVGKWLAYRHEGGQLVGRGGLSRTTLEGRDCLEVGWAVRQRYWGQGYATEIGMAGPRFAFDELHADEVVSYTELHNRPSRAVLERLGMQYLRQLVRPGLVDGLDGMQDAAPFALYRLGRTSRECTS